MFMIHVNFLSNKIYDKQIENHEYYSRGRTNTIHHLLIIYNYSALDIALACARTRLSYSIRFWLKITKISINNNRNRISYYKTVI